MILAVLILAAEGQDTTLLNYGVLGICTLMLGRFAYGAYMHERERYVYERDKREEHDKALYDQVLPAMRLMLTAAERMTSYLDRQANK